jgi:two-component system response regulator SaeR
LEPALSMMTKTCERKILAVDDGSDAIKLIKKSSQIIGVSVDGFTDPILALDHFLTHSNEYFLVISDLAMPSLNGFEFIRKIRSTSPDIKIILMTTSDITNSYLFRELASSLKIDCTVQKPISFREIKCTIQKQKLLHVTIDC